MNQKTSSGRRHKFADEHGSWTRRILAFFDLKKARTGGKIAKRLKFGQESIRSTFAHGPFKGQSIASVGRKLRSGETTPDQLPIEFIVRDGEKIALNNRSLAALRRAGLEPTRLIDRTGIPKYETHLDRHLAGRQPSDFIQIRGGPPGTSLIEP